MNPYFHLEGVFCPSSTLFFFFFFPRGGGGPGPRGPNRGIVGTQIAIAKFPPAFCQAKIRSSQARG